MVRYIRNIGNYYLDGTLFIDYPSMTEGQFLAAQVAERLRMEGTYYGEQSLLDASQMIYGSLSNGFHDNAKATGLKEVDKYLTKLLSRKGRVTKGRTQVGGPVQILNCEEMAAQIAYETYPEGANSVGDVEWNAALDQPSSTGNEGYNQIYSQYLQSCNDENYYRSVLNDHISRFGHHLLYAYEPNLSSAPAVVAAKGIQHLAALEKLSDISKIAPNMIREWVRTGIMRANFNQDIAPITPEETIANFKFAHTNDVSRATIGLDPATIATIIGIIKAIVAAVGATLALIASFKPSDKQRFQDSINDIGTNAFGPKNQDWPVYDTNNPPGDSGDGLLPGVDNNDLLLPAAIAALALLWPSK